MHLSLFSDYALRTLMYLAAQEDRQCTLREVAEAYGISLEHLRKVVHRLSVSGYIESRRGRAGGIRLGKPAEKIRIGRVVRLMEGESEIIDCEGQECVLAPRCSLRLRLRRATDAFYAQLDESTLADIVGASGMQSRLVRIRPAQTD